MINNYLKTCREALATGHERQAFSQVAVANKVGVSKSYVCRIENGTEIPSRDFLVRINQVYGLEEDVTLAIGGYLTADLQALICRQPKCLTILNELCDLDETKLTAFMNKFEKDGHIELISKLASKRLLAQIVNNLLQFSVDELRDLKKDLHTFTSSSLDFD
jgi:transcriptional regulator with XRE-family HTH domain